MDTGTGDRLLAAVCLLHLYLMTSIACRLQGNLGGLFGLVLGLISILITLSETLVVFLFWV